MASGFIEKMVEACFSRTDDGSVVFHPRRYCGRGYVLHDKAQVEAARKVIEDQWRVLPLVLIPVFVLMLAAAGHAISRNMAIFIMVAGDAAAIFSLSRRMRRFLRESAASQHPLSYRESLRLLGRAETTGRVRALIFAVPLVTIAGIGLAVSDFRIAPPNNRVLLGDMVLIVGTLLFASIGSVALVARAIARR